MPRQNTLFRLARREGLKGSALLHCPMSSAQVVRVDWQVTQEADGKDTLEHREDGSIQLN